MCAVRERKMPDRLAMHSRNSEERVKWQFDLWRVARKILRPAHKELLARQVPPECLPTVDYMLTLPTHNRLNILR
jgi:hypothetical protein